MYDFSLLDKFEECSSESNDLTSDTFMKETSMEEINLESLNSVIQDALKVYNKEVLNASHINQEMDRLNNKNAKVKEELEHIKNGIADISKYIASNYKKNCCEENIQTYNNISENISVVSGALDECLSNMNKYAENESKSHKKDYDQSIDKINSLNQIFTIAKLNKHACPICLRNESTHFTLPCGHVYCEDCSKKLSVTCFICRQNIFKVSPLFFT